jgi:predicted SnoaL-like aldol condensation-catalyzing enzyme
MIAEGDYVTKQWVWKATHPNGNKLDMTAISIYRIVDGVIVEDWWNQDVLTFYQQIGYTLQEPAAVK